MSSNVSYNVTIPDDCDWITRAANTRKTRGVETSYIMLKVAENTTYKEREAVVEVSNEEVGASESITIYQPFDMVFSVDTTSFEVSMDGATFTVNLKHNISYEVSIPSSCDWITQPTGTRGSKSKGVKGTRGTRGSGGTETTAIVFRASENTTEQEREATITISNKDAGAEVKIYVHQPFTTTFNVDPVSIEVGMEGGTETVNVESNISYGVSIPSDCNWISLQSSSSRSRAATQTRGKANTRGTKSAALLFKVSKNTTGKERSATVTIGNSSLGVSKAVTFKQKFESTFNIDESDVEVDELGGTFGVNVVANVSVSVQPLVSWLTVGGKTGEGDGYWTQQINVLSFTGKADQRQGKVKFLYAAGNESKTVTVTQKRTLYISLSDTTLTEAGEKLDLSSKLTNTESRIVSWSSSNTDVVTVSNSGTVKAVANGDAVITVRSSDGRYSDAVNVTVEIPEAEEKEAEETDPDKDSDKASDKDADKDSGSASDKDSDKASDKDSDKSTDKSSKARTRRRIR
jgi:uncharacterized alkaline shock family protein YloU